MKSAQRVPGISQITYTAATQMRIFARTPQLVEFALGLTLSTTADGWSRSRACGHRSKALQRLQRRERSNRDH